MMPRLALPALASLLVSTTLLAQDPWANVPALPTSCYAKQDEFGQTLRAAKTGLETAAAKQTAINVALQKQMTANPTAMVTALQKNPSKTAEIMNAVQKMSAPQGQAAMEATGTKQKEFDQKTVKFKADYQAEKEATLYPIHKRIRDHTRELGGTAADDEIVRKGWIELNQKYETVICPKWFAREAAGLLAAYKDYLVSDYIPKGLEAEASQKSIFELFGLPTGDFHPVSAQSAVVKYLEIALQLFDVRRNAPNLPP
jgi:hypothetical protein